MAGSADRVTADRETAAEVVVVGAGMAGLACARSLAAAGRRVRVLDKGRGIGGRMATRRLRLGAADLGFDHGAQYVTARDPAFRALLEDAVAAGAAAAWPAAGPGRRIVGVPGMSALPRWLAQGVPVEQGAEVEAVRTADGGWRLRLGTRSLWARRVVLTVPAPQAARLLGAAHPMAAGLAAVRMDPCLTLMAAFPAGLDAGPAIVRSADHPLAWIARDDSKPGRARGLSTWVAQASAGWSARHLEAEPEALRARLLALLAARLGLSPDAAIHAAAHRWRFARARVPLGRAFLRDDAGTLWVGGDWCLGDRVEAAWRSGRAIATDLLAADAATGGRG